MNEPVRETVAPEDRIQIAVEQAAPDVAVLRLTGDLDLLTAGVLHDRLWPHLDRANSAIVLDFTQVGFLGSAGLSELVAANDTATRGGVRLFLVASSRTVLRPLEITGLRPLFQVFDSVEAALRQV
jgi:anti-sigma B factor antagonist